MGEKKLSLEAKKRASRIFCWMKINRFNTNFKMERSKNKIIAKNCRKWPKRLFEKNWVEVGNLSKLAKLSQNVECSSGLLGCLGNMEIGLWGQKTGLLNFSLRQDGSFGYEYSYSGVKNIEYYRKTTKNDYLFLPKFSSFL